MNKKIKIKNKIIKLFIICFIIGTIISFLFYSSLEKSELKTLISSIKKNNTLFTFSNNMIDHIKILSVIILLTFIYIGFPLFIGLLISEGFKISLRMILLYKIYKIKGLLYGILYLLINSGVYIITLGYLLKNITKIFKIIYKKKVQKENINYNDLYKLLIKSIYFIVIVFIFDLLLYFYGSNLVNGIKKLFIIRIY